MTLLKLLQQRWLQHSLFWLAYLLYNPAKNMVFWPSFLDNLETIIWVLPVSVLGVYLNLFIFIPKLFRKKRYGLYALATLGTIALMPYLSISILKEYYTFRELPQVATLFYSVMGYFIWFTEFLVLISFSTAIKVTKQWLERERYARHLEKEKFDAEISMFKQQINPHFVFNVLNSIYFAIPKSTELAQDIVMRLSEMLSHQLYDINKEWIPVNKELEYLHNYIELEKIRQGSALQLDCDLPALIPNLQISPILLLPFVENAFKYAPTYNPSSYWVKIQAHIEGKSLHFQVSNPFEASNQVNQHKKGGIGIANVQKRLAMIYPKQHQLHISQDEQVWKVDLVIELTEQEESSPIENLLKNPN